MKQNMSCCYPKKIEVRNVYLNNLKHLDVDIPLSEFVCICGVSGSGKSSLAMGVLYAEGSRRYLESLSTYTRRRLTQAAVAAVGSIRYLPCALALRQQPAVPGIRTTVGTMSEAFNVLRLMFSRLGSHPCPNGHMVPPTLAAAQLGKETCPVDGITFDTPSAESFAFNAAGACPVCHGTGQVEEVDPGSLIGDPQKSVRQGAVAAWNYAGGSPLYVAAAKALGVNVDIPYQDLSKKEQEIILDGKAQKVPITVYSKAGRGFPLQMNYLNAKDAVERAYHKTDSEKKRKLLSRFFHIETCPACHGSRFSKTALASTLDGKNIAEVCDLPLDTLSAFTAALTKTLPAEMAQISDTLCKEMLAYVQPLLSLGLSYLTLGRSGNTLSTGELQRLQLSRTLRNETTGVLYVLDEPSVGLHPANQQGLLEVLGNLLEQGNSLVVVDHDIDLLRQATTLIEMGPGAGAAGGQLLGNGTVQEIIKNPHSIIGPYLGGTAQLIVRKQAVAQDLFAYGKVSVTVSKRFTLSNVTADFPVARLTVVTGVSGSGKTTLVMDSLVPAIQAVLAKRPLPAHVAALDAASIRKVLEIDATPIGKNSRSTLATYSGIFDTIRKMFAATDDAKKRHWGAGHFSYNGKEGICPTCMGTGEISLDVQFMPDIEMTCPTCHGKRYNQETLAVLWQGYSIADVLALSVDQAIPVFESVPAVAAPLHSLSELGLGYLALGEATPTLSGGESQRLKLVAEMRKPQKGTLILFDEPTTGLHPQDIKMLLHVFDKLMEQGSTLVVIEHNLDLIANADYLIDMGPGGGIHGGTVIAVGTPDEVAANQQSLTGRYLKDYCDSFGVS